MTLPAKKPDWLRVRLPNQEGQERFNELKQGFRKKDLFTVCEEAQCPNIFECWSAGTATIMILGETCTRGCRFCAVNTGNPGGVVDPREPQHVADSLEGMNLAYVVMTMVDRDDIFDGGASHVAETIQRTRESCPDLVIETLVGDFQGIREDIETLAREGAPDVYAHNVEVVPRLQRSIRDARCSWDQSLDSLRVAKDCGLVTKTSLMVGIGEEEHEVIEAMELIRKADVDVLTIGQYLRPTKKHAELKRYVDPEEFARYEKAGLEMGFQFVASGPLVRSSYRAAEAFLHGVLTEKRAPANADRYGKRKKLNVISK